VGVGAALALAACTGSALQAQPIAPPNPTAQPTSVLNPVYLDESPAANDAFVRVTEHLSAGNVDEAVRVLQGLIETQGDRVIATSADADVFVPVRTRALELVQSRPEFLKRYRAILSARAERAEQDKQFEVLERTLLLTGPGYDAALRLAERELEDARFEACRIRLSQVVGHPDCTGERAKKALRIAGELERYLTRADVRASVSAFGAASGTSSAAGEPVAWPSSAKQSTKSPLTPLPVLNADGMVPKPLWTVNLSQADSASPEIGAPIAGVKANAQAVPVAARDLLLLPSVSGDTVFVNDGSTVEAWDRFTLTPKWKVSPGIADAPQPEPGIRGNRAFFGRNVYGMAPMEELGTVCVAGRTVIASTGRATSGIGEGDDRVHAIDAGTGRVLWSVHVPELDAQIAASSVRGPIVVVENTVVFAARKMQQERRLMSLSLVGLSLATGELQWVRPIGSAGSPPNQMQGDGNDAISVHQGMVYRVDRLGVIGAVEAATGRIAWVRRVPVDTSVFAPEPAVPWQMSAPVVDDASVIAVAPDMGRLIRLDRKTGVLKGQRRMSEFGVQSPPRYLLSAGEGEKRVLVGVGDDRLYSVPLADIEKGAIGVTKPLAQPAIRGRVSVVGSTSLLAPFSNGAALYDALNLAGAEPSQTIALENPGQVLALERQLVVVDDKSLHSYLLWDVAEKLLQDRIRADEKDPDAPVTYAVLAYRAGRFDRIGDAVDTAMAVLKKAAKPEVAETSRRTLLNELQTMVVSSIEPGSAKAAKESLAPKPIEDRALLRRLVDRLGELAKTSDDRVAHLLALGRMQELEGAFEQSVLTYQRILDDQTLAAATWSGPQLAVRADLESMRRIESLVRQHGSGVYAAMEAKAAQEVAGLGPDTSVDALEQIVARYPVSATSVRAMLAISDKLQAQNKVQQVMAALEQGVRIAQRNPEPPKDATGELAGRLLAGLRAKQQNTAAAGLLRTVKAKFPGLVLTANGAPIDQDRVSAELADTISASMRWAKVGPVVGERAQALPGLWQLEPLIYEPMPSTSRMIALGSDDTVSLWAAPTAGSEKAGDLLVRSWMREISEETRPHLIRLTNDAAYFIFVTNGTSGADGFVEKVGGAPATSRWRSESLAKLFSREDSRSMRRVPGVMNDEMGVPGEGSQDPRNMIVTMDDRTIVLVQRSGKAAGIDTDTGDVLWTAQSTVDRVFDAQVVGGTLVIAGDQELRVPGGNETTGFKSMLHVLDARTGKPTLRITDGALATLGRTHWVRLLDSGNAIVGLESGIANIDLNTAQTNWTIRNPDIMPTTTGWLMGENLVVLAPDRGLWLINALTGRMRETALAVPKSHVDSTRSIELFALSAQSNPSFAVSTQQGLAVFNAEGELVGVDGFGGSTAMVPPRAAEGRAVTVETVAEGRSAEGLMMFSVHALDTHVPSGPNGAGAGGLGGASLLESRPILLGARPIGMSLLDDHVVVTAGSATIVLKAPAKK
jgi:outer membrane protein assembly factor BamB